MSDHSDSNDPPGNVISLPRIGSPPPPDIPLPPDFDPDPAPENEQELARISPFDAAPPAPDTVPPLPLPVVPDTFRSEPAASPVPPDAGPPRGRVLSMATLLAIALAAFEGVQTWVRERAPRRAEERAHRRQLELLAAKADTAAAKAVGKMPPSHDYGRRAWGRSGGALGGRSGRSGGAGGGLRGNGRNGAAGGPRGASGGGASGLRSGGTGPGRGGDNRQGATGRSSKDRPGGRTGGGLLSGLGKISPDRSRGRGTSNKNGGGRGGAGSGDSGRGPAGGRGGRSGDRPGETSGTGRTTLGQAAAKTMDDRWKKRRDKAQGGGSHGPSLVPKAAAKPTGSGWKPKDTLNPKGSEAGAKVPLNKTPKSPDGPGGSAKHDSGSKDGRGRTTLGQAAAKTMDDRWKKRDTPSQSVFSRTSPKSGKSGVSFTKKDADARAKRKAKDKRRRRRQEEKEFLAREKRERRERERREREERERRNREEWISEQEARWRVRDDDPYRRGDHADEYASDPWNDVRASPFEETLKQQRETTYTVTQAGPARSNRQPWEPAALDKAPPRSLPRTGPPALPRAPQRPAGPRPGTTRRKDPTPMHPVPTTAAPAAGSGGMAPQHATEVTLGDALKALEHLTAQGMETYDDCDALAAAAEQLLRDLEAMAEDLAGDHNVTGDKTQTAVADLRGAVAGLVRQANRMAQAALDAAELSEAEEEAMKRDYRPVADATADAGLVAPSARLHNDN